MADAHIGQVPFFDANKCHLHLLEQKNDPVIRWNIGRATGHISDEAWGHMRLSLIAKAVGAALLFNMTALGSAAQGPGLVTKVTVGDNGVAFVEMTSTRGTKPSCATLDRWAISASTLQGQSQLSLVATAFATGKTIYIVGTGACGIWGDTESAQWITSPN